jgi:hypothetical protein
MKWVVACILALSVQTAKAQMMFGRQWETAVALSQADMDMIKATLARQIHDKAVGTSASWSNPASGNSGTITLVKTFVRNGLRCEQIDYRLVSSGAGRPYDDYTLTSCQLADGTWKLS